MGEGRLDGIGALSFDCYGTLIDWERGIENALRPWLVRHGRGELTTATLLEAFGRHETEVEQDDPTLGYPGVLARTLHRIGGTLDVPVGDDDARAFGASVGDWPPFPDSTDALRRLQRRHTLAILSNVDRRSFDTTQAALGVTFDIVVTAEEVGAYKPDPAGFHVLFDRLRAAGVKRDAHVHVAQSLYHDHVPARQLGLRSIWIDRRGDRDAAGGSGATPPAALSLDELPTYPTLAALADALA